MNRKKRVDWEKELRKTEEIRMRGFRTSMFGFIVAILFIFGVSRINEHTFPYPIVTIVGCLFAATLVLVFTLKGKSMKSKRTTDDGNKESE